MSTLSLKKSPEKYNKQHAHIYRTKKLQIANEWVRSILPARPFSIGIFNQILKIKPDHISERSIKIVLRNKTNSNKYLKSFKTAKCRTDINGNKTELSEVHREHALNKLKKRQKERKRNK